MSYLILHQTYYDFPAIKYKLFERTAMVSHLLKPFSSSDVILILVVVVFASVVAVLLLFVSY